MTTNAATSRGRRRKTDQIDCPLDTGTMFGEAHNISVVSERPR
jgi:hypothetical protein